MFDADPFNSRRMNRIALAELAGAVLVTNADFLRRILGTTELSTQQWGIAITSALALLLTWEAAKWVARRGAAPADAAPAGLG